MKPKYTPTEGQPLTDLQEYNKLLNKLFWASVVFGTLIVIGAVYVLWNIDHYNMVSNIVRACA